MDITRYDLTEDCTTGKVDITPVPETMEGRYVSYEDYAALEARRAALAAENAALKRNLEGTAEFCYSELPETPATDAFLAEVRAQGVEMYGNLTIKIGEEEGEEEIVYAGKQALLYAAQLRQEIVQ